MDQSAAETTGRPAAIRIALADDHPAIRRSVRLLLESEPGFEVCAEGRDADETLGLCDGNLPAVLVFDVSQGARTRLDALRSLREEHPSVRVVALTMDDNRFGARMALEAGAHGYVLKEMADVDLIPAVRSAAHGETYVSPQIDR